MDTPPASGTRENKPLDCGCSRGYRKQQKYKKNSSDSVVLTVQEFEWRGGKSGNRAFPPIRQSSSTVGWVLVVQSIRVHETKKKEKRDGENELTLWWMGRWDLISHQQPNASWFNACWWRSRNEFLSSFLFIFHFSPKKNFPCLKYQHMCGKYQTVVGCVSCTAHLVKRNLSDRNAYSGEETEGIKKKEKKNNIKMPKNDVILLFR